MYMPLSALMSRLRSQYLVIVMRKSRKDVGQQLYTGSNAPHSISSVETGPSEPIC